MTRFEAAALLLLLAAPLHARPRAALPDADGLLLKALAGPATSYAAVERVQVFLPGRKPKALKAVVSGLPGKVRREVFPPKKKAAPLVQVREREKPEAGLARLRAVYDLALSTGGVVAKRRTWTVELRLKNGILRRRLWLDRDSGLLMKRETYRDDGTLARRERIVKLELPAAVAPFEAGSAPAPWAPDGFVYAGESGGARRWSNGLESYEIRRVAGKAIVSGDLAEDDAARAAESASK